MFTFCYCFPWFFGHFVTRSQGHSRDSTQCSIGAPSKTRFLAIRNTLEFSDCFRTQVFRIFNTSELALFARGLGGRDGSSRPSLPRLAASSSYFLPFFLFSFLFSSFSFFFLSSFPQLFDSHHGKVYLKKEWWLLSQTLFSKFKKCTFSQPFEEKCVR